MHSWLGVLVMPWVLIIGATGLYLNHPDLVLGLLGYAELSERDLAGAPMYQVSKDLALLIAASIWPEEAMKHSGSIRYRGRDAYGIEKDSGLIIVPGPESNHYFVRTKLAEETYTMEGKLIHKQYNLKTMLKSLHERGWVDSRFGTWLADIVATAMLFFSTTGLIMWSVPKLRRMFRNARPMPKRKSGRAALVE
jgi:hypothetical protein